MKHDNEGNTTGKTGEAEGGGGEEAGAGAGGVGVAEAAAAGFHRGGGGGSRIVNLDNLELYTREASRETGHTLMNLPTIM